VLTKLFNPFKCALRGLVTTWQEENNFRLEIIATLVVVFCLFYFNFSFVESALCILVITVVLSAEIINTAVEDLCNKVESEYDPIIAKIKDTSSGFVLVSSLGAFIVGAIVFYHHFL
jgi:diacylglycerol kinase